MLSHTTENGHSIAAFQQLEVDYYIGTPNQSVHPTDLQETPIVRMYGVTENGEAQDKLSLCLSSGHALQCTAHCSEVCMAKPYTPPIMTDKAHQYCYSRHIHALLEGEPPAYAGNSVCAFVHGFQPYFYIEAPRGFGPDDCDALCSQLNVRTLS